MASGFLEKRSAISRITDISNNDEFNELDDYDTINEENLEDFVSEK